MLFLVLGKKTKQKNELLTWDLSDLYKGIDDKQNAYDDVEERRELEQAAKMLFR